MNSPLSGVVTLLDLLKFNAHEFVTIARKISWIETMAERFRKDHPERMHLPLPDEMFEESVPAFTEMRDGCHALLLDSAEDQMNRIIGLATSKPTAEQIVSSFTELQNRIDDQLARRSFYQLNPEVAPLFENPFPFGEEVAAKFPSASHNIAEACKCYACDRFDATVYHLMRAMEVALRCLAKRVQVGYSPNWMTYLDRIDKVLKSKAKKTSIRKSRLKFLSNASALLRSVKEAWRDDTMHVAGKYGPDQTRDILFSVRAFMIHLSSELSEEKKSGKKK
ncbi:hypothetical protein [Tunturiibacter gelidoferens]|uniref:Uncharacterized protein n=1 Tax=Tunturiibacter gelidiferens TaxID=3069689 RepID=A0ACC5P1V4_9BACT|nr:hypothetical protein [Edaphobacter lichenicola]MBB5340827.1 hypothetical protein [Edaphobacter lichenicola]